MNFLTLPLRINLVAMLIFGYVFLLCITRISFAGASIIHQISPDAKLDDTASSLMQDAESRLDSIEDALALLRKQYENQQERVNKLEIQNQNQYEEMMHQKDEIDQLKNQNEKQKQEILQIKSELCRLLDFGTKNDESIEMPKVTNKVKRQTSETDTVSSSSWAKLEISDHVIGYMDYDTYTVKIYDHSSNKGVNVKNEHKKYYFEPIGQLDHFSAKSAFNNISRKPEMMFHVNMWSDGVRNAVHKFISDDLNLTPVNMNLVRILPMDRVMMFSGEIGFSASSPNFEIEQNWIDYKSDKFLKFKYICGEMKQCDDLAVQMKTNPEQFQLKMRFSLSSQKSQTKETKISTESIMHGEMMNELDQKFTGKDVVLLTADGKKQLLKESSENVIIQTVDDTHQQVPSKSSQIEIYRRLENMLQFSRVTIKRGDEKAWESNVFWNNDNYRPDQSARTMNELYKKLDKENQNKFASSFSSTNKIDAGSSGSGWGFSLSSQLAADFSRAGTESRESIEKLLSESRDRVEWDGLKFVPKQMELYAINIARLKNTQAFKDTNVRITYTTSVLTIDVRHESSIDSKTSSEFFEMKTQFSDLKTKFENLSKEMKELGHVKRKELQSPESTPPSSCTELFTLGHYLNGLYIVANKSTKKIQIVNCLFGFSGSIAETLVGNLEVKTKSVHFYVQRMSTFNSANAVIPFELERLNVGGAMATTSGIFTAPVDGIYHFEFVAQKDGCTSCILGIYFQVNGIYAGYARTSTNGDHETTSFTASLRLKSKDRVNLFKEGAGSAALYGSYTFFTGWLVEEDL